MMPDMVAPTISVRGVQLRADPAREPCFKVVHLYTELWRTIDMSAESQREKLHREYNAEVQGMEIAAQSLVEFPDAPWDLRMEIARQCWDESRHAQLYAQRLKEKGGFKGEFPIANHEWTTTCVFETLVARLAIQNRTFESGSMDSMRKAIKVWNDAGDPRTAEITDGILADEVQHVRYANQWLNRFARDDPKIVLHIATTMARLRQMSAALRPQPGDVSVNGVDLIATPHASVHANIDDRQHAKFSSAEITAVVQRQQAEETNAFAPTRLERVR
jgi:bacterioferritin (cytochrome b1)